MTKAEVLFAVVAVVGSVVVSSATASYMMGEKVSQIFTNTDRIIILEDRDGKLYDAVMDIKVDTALNKAKLQWIKDQKQQGN